MTISGIISAAMASLVLVTTEAQPRTNDAHALLKVQRAEAAMDSAIRHAQLDNLLRWFAPDAVWLPEYHHALYTMGTIRDYFRGWFESARILAWDLKPFELQRAGNYLFETGNGRIEFLHKPSTGASPAKPYSYFIKYLRYWRLTKDGSVQLLSNILGSSRDLPREDLPMSGFRPPDINAIPHVASSPVHHRIDSLGDRFAAMVLSGDGASFAQYYAPDAIYMPYFSPMLIGKNALDRWYRQHESPKTDCSIRIGMSRITDAGDYVLGDGYYVLQWGQGPSANIVSGKNMTIWKRGKDGRLLIYRQMTAHD